MDKMPKIGFKPKKLNPEACGDDLEDFITRQDYFKWSNAAKGVNAHNFGQVVERDKISFLKEQS